MPQARLAHGRITDMAISPDGSLLAVGSSRGIYLYDALTLELKTSFLLPDEKEAATVAWLPDGKALAAGYADGVRTWNLEKRAVTWWYSQIPDVTHIDWSPAGSRLLILNTGFIEAEMNTNIYTDLRVMDAYSNHVYIRRTDLNLNTNQAFWSPDGERVVYIAGKPLPLAYHDTDSAEQIAPETQVIIWTADGSQPDLALFPSDDLPNVQSVAWSPDGTHLALDVGGYRDGNIQIWDAAEGKRVRNQPTGALPAWSADGSRFLVYHEEYERGVAIYDSSLTLMGSEFLPIGEAQQLLLSSDGSRLYASQWGTLVMYDTANGQPLASLDQHPFRTIGAQWSPDGAYLATYSDNAPSGLATVFIWKATGELEQRITTDGTIYRMVWSPDSRQLTLIKADTLEIYTLADTAAPHIITTDKPHGLAWSPDGQQIAVMARSGTVEIRDAATGEQIEQYLSPVDNLRGTANHADSRISWTPAAGLQWLIHDWDDITRIYTRAQVEPVADLGVIDYVLSGGTPEFLPDGRLGYVAQGLQNTLNIYDVALQTVVESYPLHHNINHANRSSGFACYANASYAEQVTNTRYGSLHIFDLQGQSIRQDIPIPGRLDHVVWSPDGKRIAILLDDGTITLWGVPLE